MKSLQASVRTLQLLNEVELILDSIRTIALVETQHSRRWLESQQQGQASMQPIVEILWGHWGRGVGELSRDPTVRLVIGSERGFCGDYNSRLVSRCVDRQGSPDTLVAVGYRLNSKLQGMSRAATALAGASVAAELEVVLAAVMQALSDVVGDQLRRVKLVYWSASQRGVLEEWLVPDLANLPEPQGLAPLIQLSPGQLLAEVMTEFVLSRISAVLTEAFVAENERRIDHLSGALERMKEQRAHLQRQQQSMRQEQITEELEMIMLSGAG